MFFLWNALSLTPDVTGLKPYKKLNFCLISYLKTSLESWWSSRCFLTNMKCAFEFLLVSTCFFLLLFFSVSLLLLNHDFLDESSEPFWRLATPGGFTTDGGFSICLIAALTVDHWSLRNAFVSLQIDRCHWLCLSVVSLGYCCMIQNRPLNTDLWDRP